MMTSGRPGLGGLAAIAAAVLLSSACSRQPAPPPPREHYRLHVLEPPDLDPLKACCLEKIRSAYPAARIYPDHDAWIAAARALHDGGILLIPDADFYPVNHLDWLDSYLRSGGRLLLTGPRPFSAEVVQSGTRFLSREEFSAVLASNAAAWLPPLAQWSAVTPETAPAEMRTISGPESLRSWTFTHLSWTGRAAALEAATVDADLIQPAFIFCGKAPGAAVTMALVAERTDGTCVRHVIELEKKWKVFSIPLGRFLVSPAAGGPPLTASTPARCIRHWKIILQGKPRASDTNHPSSAAAADLSDFHIVELPWAAGSRTTHGRLSIATLAHMPVVSKKQCPLVTPEGKRLTVNGPVGLFPGLPPGSDTCSHGLQRIEALFALEHADPSPGWCGIVCRQRATGPTVLNWGWLGVKLGCVDDPDVGKLLGPLLSSLRRGAYLLSAQTDRRSAAPGDTLVVNVSWMAANPRWASGIRAAVSLVEDNGKTQCRCVARPGEGCLLGDQYPLTFDLPVSGSGTSRVSELSLVCEIADVRRGPEPVDRVVQPVLCLSTGSQPRECVQAQGAAFRMERRYAPLLAVRYAPAAGWYERNGRWLLPGSFDPALVRYDLDQLASLGLNTVAVTLNDPRQVPQLRYLAELARRDGLWVVADLPAFNPFTPDFGAMESLLASLGPHALSDLCALQLDVSLPEKLEILGDLWTAWLTEQYGSPNRAEKLFGSLSLGGYSGRRVSRSPLFRRFAADLMLRFSSWLRTELDGRNYEGMLGAVCDGLAGDWTIGCLAGSRLLDFVTIRIDIGRCSPSMASAAVRLARGLAGGKPVCLAPVVSPCLSRPAPPHALIALSLDLARQTRAAGILFPESRVPLGRQWQGVALLDCAGKPADWTADLRRQVRALVTGWAPPDTGRVVKFNPWAEDTSLAGLVRHLVRQKDAEIRAEGGARRPPSSPLTSFGRPARPPCPLDGFNTVWTDIEVNGRPISRKPFRAVTVSDGDHLRFRLENVGAWEWRILGRDQGGRVAVLAHSSGQAKRCYLEVDQGADDRRSAWFKWTAHPGVWRIRAVLDGQLPFGEELTIRVIQAD